MSYDVSTVTGFSLAEAEKVGYFLARAIAPRVEPLAAGVVREIEGSYVLEKCLPTGVHNFISNTLENALAQLEDWLGQHQAITGDDESLERVKEARESGAPDSKEVLSSRITDAEDYSVAPVGTAGMPTAPDGDNPSPETAASTPAPEAIKPIGPPAVWPPKPPALVKLEVDAEVEAMPTASDPAPAEEEPEAPPEGTVQA